MLLSNTLDVIHVQIAVFYNWYNASLCVLQELLDWEPRTRPWLLVSVGSLVMASSSLHIHACITTSIPDFFYVPIPTGN